MSFFGAWLWSVHGMVEFEVWAGFARHGHLPAELVALRPASCPYIIGARHSHQFEKCLGLGSS